MVTMAQQCTKCGARSDALGIYESCTFNGPQHEWVDVAETHEMTPCDAPIYEGEWSTTLRCEVPRYLHGEMFDHPFIPPRTPAPQQMQERAEAHRKLDALLDGKLSRTKFSYYLHDVLAAARKEGR